MTAGFQAFQSQNCQRGVVDQQTCVFTMHSTSGMQDERGWKGSVWTARMLQ